MKRLLDELPPGFERDLLSAGERAEANANGRERALRAAMGALAGASVTGAAQAVAQVGTQATTTAVATKAVPLTLKVVLAVSIGSATIGASLYGAHVLKSEREATRAPVAAPAVAIEPAPAAPAQVEATHVEEAAPARPGKKRLKPHARASVSDESLRLQIGRVDEARATLTRGDARGALATLEAYRQSFPEGAFRMEADLLQVESLIALGRRAEAEALAERAANKGGAAYRAKLEALLAR